MAGRVGSGFRAFRSAGVRFRLQEREDLAAHERRQGHYDQHCHFTPQGDDPGSSQTIDLNEIRRRNDFKTPLGLD